MSTTRVSNADLLKALLSMQARIDTLEAQLSAPVKAENVKAENVKATKETKAVLFQGVVSKGGKSGQDLVIGAVIERDWTWVTMSEAPCAEIASVIRLSAENPKGGKFSRGRMAWAFKYHLNETEFVKLLGKYGKKYSAR